MLPMSTIMNPRPEWQEHALCRGMTHVFFPEEGTDPTPVRVCQQCPVIAECAEAGRDELFGVWGGQRKADRLRFRKHYARS